MCCFAWTDETLTLFPSPLFSSFLFCSEKVLGHFFDTTSNIFNLKRAKEQHKLKDTSIMASRIVSLVRIFNRSGQVSLYAFCWGMFEERRYGYFYPATCIRIRSYYLSNVLRVLSCVAAASPCVLDHAVTCSQSEVFAHTRL